MLSCLRWIVDDAGRLWAARPLARLAQPSADPAVSTPDAGLVYRQEAIIRRSWRSRLRRPVHHRRAHR
jgi:hypothetical protein